MTCSCWQAIWPIVSAAPISPGLWGAHLRWTYGVKSVNRVPCSGGCKPCFQNLKQTSLWVMGNRWLTRRRLRHWRRKSDSFEDIVSARFLLECHKKFALPNTATLSDEFATAGVLPAGLTSPGPDNDLSASISPLSTTPSPQENVQEVPGTQAPSPALSRLLEEMEHCPSITPVPSSLTIPRTPLAPVPCPFRDSFSAAQPVERTAEAAAFDLLETGSWSSLCPGRRDWAKGSVDIPLPVKTITWPPRNWPQMTKEQRQVAWQAMAIVLSLADEPTGSFPTHDPAVIMEDYSSLALPGSGPTPSATTPADRAVTELRATNHRGLKYALEDTHDHRHLHGLTQGLAAGVCKGLIGRRRVLELVNAAVVPLRPLQEAKNMTKMAPPVKKTAAGETTVQKTARQQHHLCSWGYSHQSGTELLPTHGPSPPRCNSLLWLNVLFAGNWGWRHRETFYFPYHEPALVIEWQGHTCLFLLGTKPLWHWRKWKSWPTSKRDPRPRYRPTGKCPLYRYETTGQLLHSEVGSNQVRCSCTWQRSLSCETNTGATEEVPALNQSWRGCNHPTSNWPYQGHQIPYLVQRTADWLSPLWSNTDHWPYAAVCSVIGMSWWILHSRLIECSLRDNSWDLHSGIPVRSGILLSDIM